LENAKLVIVALGGKTENSRERDKNSNGRISNKKGAKETGFWGRTSPS